MSLSLFKKALTTAFQASQPLLIAAETLVLDFGITVASDAVIQWYLEFSEDFTKPNSWFQEVTQEVTQQGAVGHFIALRTFYPNGGTGALTSGGSPYALEVEFVRRAKFARVQIKATSGTATVTITAPFGLAAIP